MSLIGRIGLPFNKGAVERATLNDPEPPPAYLQKEIVSSSYLSMVEIHKTVGELVKKVLDGGVHTKYKALKILLAGCKEGHLNFRLEVREVAMAAIRKCGVWEGEQDLIHGDFYNERVRGTANELMLVTLSDAGFEQGKISEQCRITGYGTSSEEAEKPATLSSWVGSGVSWALSWVNVELPEPTPPEPVHRQLVDVPATETLFTPPEILPPPPKRPPQKLKDEVLSLSDPSVLCFSHPWQVRLEYLKELSRPRNEAILRKLAQNPVFTALLEHQQNSAQKSVKIAAAKVRKKV
eukprot:TRINITY_DN13091_c0_g1_i1.p1 TRINITY_DN13091_c0_g1~~TRINITY_DN13091_c0_g1_i1.p1  ORF type:complete len:308 (+),score=43.77 TRINITY_DN13091_c0_g1_i1:44-925(+)